MNELTEQQFEMLREFVNSETILIFVPEILDTDNTKKRAKQTEIRADIMNLVNNGFLDNKTENFQDAIDEAKRKLKRGCEVYRITPAAQQMFKPSEGLVN